MPLLSEGETHGGPAIPVEVSELTEAWCTEMLQARAPGAVCDSLEILDAHSGTTGRARIGLQCDDPRVPASLFVKLPPFTDDRRSFVDSQGMGVAEARFYAEVAGELPHGVRLPEVWSSVFDDNGGYLMVLEDLALRGARQPLAKDNDIAATVDGVIDSLAALHAAFWESERCASGGDLEWIQARSRRYSGAATFVQHAVDVLADDMPTASRALAELYLDRVDDIVSLLGAGPRTLTHGDAHLGNMWVDDLGVGLLDWAVVGFGVGMRDIAYFIGNSVSTEFRRQHERRLIERYCAAVGAAGVPSPVEDAWDQYRLHMVSPWVAAVVTASYGNAMQSVEVGRRAVQRSDRSIADLGTVDLLRELLPLA